MRSSAGLRERVGTSEAVAQTFVFWYRPMQRWRPIVFLKLFSKSFVTECLDDRVFGHRIVSSGVFGAQLLNL